MDEEGAALGLSLVLSLFLAGLHLAAPWLRRLRYPPERVVASFGGGAAAAYVFAHTLPELAETRDPIGRALEGALGSSQVEGLLVFLVALLGFTIFYALEQAARDARRRRDQSARMFAVHLGAYCVYNLLITGTMALRLEAGVPFGVVFGVVMGLHFVLTDRTLEDHYPDRFTRWGRHLLAASLLLGWGASILIGPEHLVLLGLLTSLLAGSVLYNVFKEELPDHDRSSFPAFACGLVGNAALLTLLTALDA